MQTNPNSPFTAVVGLGPLKTEHPYKGSGKWVGLIFGIFCLVAAPVAGLLAIYFGYDAYSRHGLNRVDDAVIVPLGCAAVSFVVGALTVFSAWRNWPLAAALYESGFAFNDRGGLKQLQWEQIQSVWQNVTKHYRNGIYMGTTHIYTVQAGDGAKIVLDDKLAQVEALGQAIQTGAAKALWPKYVEALQGGQRLTFGPLALDKNGLYTGNKALRWDEINAVKIQRGIISIKKEGGWFNWASATVPQIPNFYIFYELLGRMTKVE